MLHRDAFIRISWRADKSSVRSPTVREGLFGELPSLTVGLLTLRRCRPADLQCRLRYAKSFAHSFDYRSVCLSVWMQANIASSISSELIFRQFKLSVRSDHDGMILINGGKFVMGTNDGMPYESPTHEATVKSFWMDRHEVTIAEFAKFVTATGYQTDAEKFGWSGAFNLKTRRWKKTKGADWRHPDGPDRRPRTMNQRARFRGMTRRPMRVGPANVCRQKPNGNLLRAADWFRRSILGAMTCGQVANRSRTGGKAPFPIAILTKMDLSARARREFPAKRIWPLRDDGQCLGVVRRFLRG